MQRRGRDRERGGRETEEGRRRYRSQFLPVSRRSVRWLTVEQYSAGTVVSGHVTSGP